MRACILMRQFMYERQYLTVFHNNITLTKLQITYSGVIEHYSLIVEMSWPIFQYMYL